MPVNGSAINGYTTATLEPIPFSRTAQPPVEISKRIATSYDNAWPVAKELTFANAIWDHQHPIAYGTPLAVQNLHKELQGHTDGSLPFIDTLSRGDLSRIHKAVSTVALGIRPFVEAGVLTSEIADSPAKASNFLSSAIQAKNSGSKREFHAYYDDTVKELGFAAHSLSNDPMFFDTILQPGQYEDTIAAGIRHFNEVNNPEENIPSDPSRPQALFLPFTILAAASAYDKSKLDKATPHAARMAKIISSAMFPFLPEN